MKYRLSRYWILRRDELRKRKKFSLFNIITREKRSISKSTFMLLKLFEIESIDIVDSFIEEEGYKNISRSLNRLIKESILVEEDLYKKDFFYVYNDLISDKNVSLLKNKYKIPIYTTPLKAEIHFTHSCNLSCDYCAYSAEAKKSEMIKAEQWFKIFNQLEELKLHEVVFSGGELFLHPEIEELLQNLSQRHFAVTLFTNGTLITSKHIPILKSKNIKVGISLDGIDCISHDTYRGDNTLGLVLKTIDLFEENQIDFYISSTMHRLNWQNIEDLVKYAIDKNAKAIDFRKVAKIGRCKEEDRIHLSEMELELCIEKIELLQEIYPDFPITFLDVDIHNKNNAQKKNNYDGVYCTAGTSRITIDPKGDVYPCILCFNDKDFLIHNALKENISEYWFKADWPLVREPIDLIKLPLCNTCSKNKFCTEVNCRLGAYYSNNKNIHGMTPFCPMI